MSVVCNVCSELLSFCGFGGGVCLLCLMNFYSVIYSLLCLCGFGGRMLVGGMIRLVCFVRKVLMVSLCVSYCVGLVCRSVVLVIICVMIGVGFRCIRMLLFAVMRIVLLYVMLCSCASVWVVVLGDVIVF